MTAQKQSYSEFLQSKVRAFQPIGIDVKESDLPDYLFPFQRRVVAWALKRGRAALFEGCGLGKMQPVSEPVLTPFGWRPIGSLRLGDTIIGRTGLAKVTGVYPQGDHEIVRVSFSDGAFTRCGWEHLWHVQSQRNRNNGDYQIMTTRQLSDRGLRYGRDRNSRQWSIPLIQPIHDLPHDLPLDAYELGVILGDGTITEQGYVSITTDYEIIDKMKAKGTITPHRTTEWVGNFKTNDYKFAMRSLGLTGCRSWEKFIPDQFMRASTAQRLALLQGLMDTDGYASGVITEFSSTSERLMDDTVMLVRSLGGIARKKGPRVTYFKDSQGTRKAGRPSWRLTVKLPPGLSLFRLTRKRDAYIPPTKYPPLRLIDSIDSERIKEECVCIAVDAPDQLYVTRDYVVTHNTVQSLVWCVEILKRINEPILILAPLGVVKQTVEEGAKFGIKVNPCKAQRDVRPGINITNYDKLHLFDANRFGGIVLDESSIVKSFDGKTRTAIIEAFQDIPYRLACTATPAPNDHMELGNHSEFLGILTRSEMLAEFFTHDGGDTSKWRLRKHGEKNFWKWVATWAVMINKPSDLGFDDNGFILPELKFHKEIVDTNLKSDGFLPGFHPETQSIQDRRTARRASLSHRVEECVKLIKASNEQWLVWVDLNAEQDALAKALAGECASIQGSTKDDKRIELEASWRKGQIKTMISKSSIFGFGMNWQHCRNVVFLGLSDSFEMFYQALRRVWRFGQANIVNCYVIISSGETVVFKNIQRKEKQAEEAQENMVVYMKEIGECTEIAEREGAEYKINIESGEGWKLYLGDSVEIWKQFETDGIDYTIFSPPFASLYVYNSSERDLGNCRDLDMFIRHFRFLVQELYRTTRPGRLLSFHCMNLPTLKSHHGYIGLEDFRGDLIRLFQASGFIFHSEVVIWKDPVTAMQRTKALGLLHKQLCKDSAMSRQGVPDYLVTVRKPGENQRRVRRLPNARFPIEGGYIGDEGPVLAGYINHTDAEGNVNPDTGHSIAVWQRYASPVWFDINPSDTLQYTTARDPNDERHIAPLQLQVIERAIELWTNPDDLVASPFAGIGSEPYVALRMDRRALGVELKESYFKVAVKNMRGMEGRKRNIQSSLFSESAD